jgi:hypothetical protein
MGKKIRALNPCFQILDTGKIFLGFGPGACAAGLFFANTIFVTGIFITINTYGCDVGRIDIETQFAAAATDFAFGF